MLGLLVLQKRNRVSILRMGEILHHLRNHGMIRFPRKYQRAMVSHGLKAVQNSSIHSIPFKNTARRAVFRETSKFQMGGCGPPSKWGPVALVRSKTTLKQDGPQMPIPQSGFFAECFGLVSRVLFVGLLSRTSKNVGVRPSTFPLQFPVNPPHHVPEPEMLSKSPHTCGGCLERGGRSPFKAFGRQACFLHRKEAAFFLRGFPLKPAHAPRWLAATCSSARTPGRPGYEKASQKQTQDGFPFLGGSQRIVRLGSWVFSGF